MINRTLSLGLDPLWRRRVVRRAAGSAEMDALDVCTGTGDLAIGLARAGAGRVVGVDLSEGMLAAGKEKVRRRGLAGEVELRHADALNLPYPEASFDIACISFGLRNLPNRAGGIAEMARVLRPGGRVLVLEFSPPGSGPVGALVKTYLSAVVPLVGGLLSGNRAAYRYLHTSIAEFLSPAGVCRLLVEAGLRRARYYPLAAGIVGLCYVAASQVLRRVSSDGAPAQERHR